MVRKYASVLWGFFFKFSYSYDCIYVFSYLPTLLARDNTNQIFAVYIAVSDPSSGPLLATYEQLIGLYIV